MRIEPIGGLETWDRPTIAARVNALIAAHNEREAGDQADGGEAADLRAENGRLRVENAKLGRDYAGRIGDHREAKQLRARVAELEADAATLARIQEQVDRTGWTGIAAEFQGIEDAVSQLIAFCREHSDPIPPAMSDEVVADREVERQAARVRIAKAPRLPGRLWATIRSATGDSETQGVVDGSSGAA